MDSPQYIKGFREFKIQFYSFKPYYKWIVLNTLNLKKNIDFMTF